jgi:DNA-binding XRE family transcriptional regulator
LTRRTYRVESGEMKKKKIKTDVPALIAKMRSAVDVQSLPRHLIFRCFKCREVLPVALMFTLVDGKPRCPKCAAQRARRKLRLSDFPDSVTIRRVSEGEPLTLGESIRARRRAAGLTQAQLAERLGVSRITINKWERQRILPNGEHRWSLTQSLQGATVWGTACPKLR